MDILEFKNMFKVAKRTASNFDEFCTELGLYLEAAKKMATETKTITIEVSDSESQLIKLLEDIKESAEVGHSFNVIVDPDEDGGRAYGMDGDGSFKISDIKITEDAKEEIEEKEAFVERLSFDVNTVGEEPTEDVPYELLEEIAEEIKNGMTEGKLQSEGGVYTYWQLKINSWRDETSPSEEGDLGKDYE